MIMRFRLLIAGLGATALLAVGAAPAFAHQGGHPGGCADFGHANIPQQGPIIASFASSGPGVVADIVENIDHAACG